MSTVFKLKRSSVKGKAPTTSNIELGEIAINTNDGRLFFKTTDSASSSAIVTLREISAGTGMTQTGGELKISDTGVVTGSYGSATEIPILSINAQGQIDSASTVTVAGVSGLAYDSDTNLLTLSTADGGSYSVKIDLSSFTDSDTTDDLPEGSTNQYFTNARVQTHLGAVTGSIIPDTDSAYDLGSASNKFRDLYLSNASIYLGGIKIQADEANNRLVVADSQGNTNNFSYDLGQNTTDDLPEGTTNLYYDSDRTITTARHAISASGNLSYNATTGVISYTDVAYAGFDSDFSAKSTTDLSEGSNLYFTNARARQAVNFEDNGGFGSFSYDTGTGIFSYTGVSTADIRNQFSGGTGINISSGSISTTITQYTDADARGAVSVTDAGGDGSLSYDSATGIFTYTGPSASEVRAHFSAGTGIGITNGQISTSITQYTDADARGAVSATDAGGDGSFSYDSDTGVFTYTGPSASEVRAHFSAGTGIGITNGEISTSITQYTDADARGAVSATDAGGDGSFSYDSGTGVFTYTGPSASEVRSHFSAGTGITLTNGQIATTITQYSDADARGAISVTDNGTFGSLAYNSGTGVLTYSDIDSADIRAMFSGGSNITISPSGEIATGLTQYTDADARATVSATDAGGDGSFSYDSGTGIFTYTGPSASEVRAHFSAGTGISITNGQIATSITQYSDADARGAISVTDNGTFGSLSYNNGTGTLTYSDIDSADIRAMFSGGSNITISPSGEIATGLTQYTDADARATVSVTDAGGDGSLSYDSGTGIFTYTGPSASEVRAHISAGGDLSYNSGTGVVSFTERTDQEVRNIFSASGDLNYDSSTGQFSFTAGSVYTNTQFDSDLGTKTTDDLAQGSTNLYYDSATTQTNARNAISVTDAGGDGSLGYNASTGTITYTGPSASETRAHFSGGTGVTITNGSVAIGQSVGTTDDVTFGKVTADSAALDNIAFTRRTSAPRPDASLVGGELFFDSDGAKGLTFIPRTQEGNTDVAINIGQEEVVYVYNGTGETINNGNTIRFVGAHSDGSPTVEKTLASSPISGPIGMATQDIPDGAHGYITTQGIVRGIDTIRQTTGGPFSVGDRAYICNVQQGGWVKHDIGPDSGYPFELGTVVVADSNDGAIFINPVREHWTRARFSGKVKTSGDLQADGDVTTRSIKFDGTIPEYAEGEVFYDSANGALAFKNDVSDITMQIGQEHWIRVYNNSGGTIGNGTPVYVTGANNNFPTIAKASATADATVHAVGLTTHSISNGQYGYVTYRGVVNDVDTSAFSAGDKVHVGTTAGTFSTVAPTYPNFAVDLGYVLTADSAGGGGSILVDVIDHVFEVVRTTGDARMDGDLTVAGNLTILGTETKNAVATLAVADQFVTMNDGDTVTAIFGAGLSGLNDLTFKGTYEGDSDKYIFVKITDTHGHGDDIQWGFDSANGIGEFTPLTFDSAGGTGPLTHNLGDDRTLVSLDPDLGISVTFDASSGHTDGNYWKGTASPSNLDFGFFGNYNKPDLPFTHAGLYRDASDSRFKFVERYDLDPTTGNINPSQGNFTLGEVNATRFHGALTGDVTGNADTATTLANGRTIGISGEVSGTGVSFNGSQDITISGTTIGSGVIDNDNISSSAAIADSKLATISTTGKVQNGATTATSDNTANAIVARDVSGNFTAGTITADLTGDVTGTVSSLSNHTSTIRGLFSVDNTLSYDSDTGQFSITNPGTDSAGTHAIFSVDSSANTGDGSLTYNNAGVFTYVGPSASETRAHFSAGTGITLTNGTIATTITQYADADARGAVSLSADNGISTLAYNSGTGQFTFHGADSADIRTVFSGGTGISINGSGEISTSITQYADADARSAISRTNTGTGYGSIDYNSSTGVINYNRVTDANIRSAISAGTGISISNGQISSTITQYADGDARGAISLSADNGISTLAYNNSTGVLTFHGADSADIRTVFSGGTGISISGTGEISTSITQYADADARGAISRTNTGTGYGSIDYNSSTGVINYNRVTNANIRSAISAGTGISISNGQISTSITQYTDADAQDAITLNATNGLSTLSKSGGTFTFTSVDSADVRGVFSGGTGISISGTGEISTSITQYADADARSAVSGGNTGTGFGSLGYNSSTGAFTFTKVTKANVLSSLQAGTGITLDSANGTIATSITQYSDADARSAVSGTNSGSGYGSLGYNSGTGQFTFTKVTNANIRGAFSEGTGISISNGEISTSITQYEDADARGAISRTNTGTGFGSIDYNSSTGVINYNKVTKANIRSALQVSGDLSFDSSNGMLSFSETYSTAAELLTALKTVDTNSSGLNADTLDGEQGSHYRINVYNSSGTLLN